MLNARISGTVLAVALMGGGPALAEKYEQNFDFRIAGIKAGEVSIKGETVANGYVADARVTSTGLIGRIADFYYVGTSRGAITGGGRPVPKLFEVTSRSPRAERETRIEFEGGTPVSVSVEPPRSTSPDPASQAGTLDPISAGFAVLKDGPVEGICNKQVDIFDGSRRSRIALAPARESGGDLVCDGRYTRLEGEENTFSSSDYGFQIVYSESDGHARLQRIETKTKFGAATVERR